MTKNKNKTHLTILTLRLNHISSGASIQYSVAFGLVFGVVEIVLGDLVVVAPLG